MIDTTSVKLTEWTSCGGCAAKWGAGPLDASVLPLYPGALETAGRGVRAGGDRRNRELLATRVIAHATATREALAYDPQTSGGLLATVDPQGIPDLRAAGFVHVGEVFAGPAAVVLS